MVGGQTSFIPIKVNIAGVMSIIFAISILQFPYTINQLIQSTTLSKISNVLSTHHPVGAVLYVILIFLFYILLYLHFCIQSQLKWQKI